MHIKTIPQVQMLPTVLCLLQKLHVCQTLNSVIIFIWKACTNNVAAILLPCSLVAAQQFSYNFAIFFPWDPKRKKYILEILVCLHPTIDGNHVTIKTSFQNHPNHFFPLNPIYDLVQSHFCLSKKSFGSLELRNGVVSKKTSGVVHLWPVVCATTLQPP